MSLQEEDSNRLAPVVPLVKAGVFFHDGLKVPPDSEDVYVQDFRDLSRGDPGPLQYQRYDLPHTMPQLFYNSVIMELRI